MTIVIFCEKMWLIAKVRDIFRIKSLIALSTNNLWILKLGEYKYFLFSVYSIM